MEIKEFRKKYPMYNQLSDEELGSRLYKKYYQNRMDYDEFQMRFGMKERPTNWVGAVGHIAKGGSGGLARPVGAGINAAVTSLIYGGLDLLRGKGTGGFGRGWNTGWNDIYQEGLAAEREFEKYNPKTAMALQIGGGLMTAPLMGAASGAQKMKLLPSLAKASMLGGIGGAVYNAAESESLDEVFPNAIEGGKVGMIMGPVAEVGTRAIGKVIGKVADTASDVYTRARYGKEALSLQKTMRALKRELGEESFEQAVQASLSNGRSLIENLDDRGVLLAQKLVAGSGQAREVLTKSARELSETAPDRIRGQVNKTLGLKKGSQNIAEIEEKYNAPAKKLYQQLDEVGDVEDVEIKNFLDSLTPEEVKSLKKYQPEEYVSILKSIVRNEYKTNPNFRFRIENGKRDYGHLLKDQTREEFIQTFKDTYHHPDILVSFMEDGNLKEYFIKKYRSELGNDLWDMIVQKGGEIKTKIARFDKKGKNYIKNSIKEGTWQPSTYPKAIGQTVNDPSQSTLPTTYISKIRRLVNKNKMVSSAIRKVKNSNASLADLPDTDFRVLNEAYKYLSEAGRDMTSGVGYASRTAQKELAKVMDDVLPDFKTARGMYRDAYLLKEAQSVGQDSIFNPNVSVDDFRAMVTPMSEAEKASLAVGVRDKVLNMVGNFENETRGLGKILPKNTRDKLKIALGEQRAGELIRLAEDEIRRMRTFNEILRQSRTAELQRMQREGLSGVWDYIRSTANKGLLGAPLGVAEDLAGVGLKRGYAPLANILTNNNVSAINQAYLRNKRLPSVLMRGLYDGKTVPLFSNIFSEPLLNNEEEQ